MVCKLAGTTLLISVVAALLGIQSSTSTPIQNESLESLSIRLNSLQELFQSNNAENAAKIQLLEVKNAENEEKIGHLIAKNAEQEGKIIKLEAKIDANKLESDHSAGPFRDDGSSLHSTGNNYKMSSIYRKETSEVAGGSTTKAILPSSCRDLSLIGHNLDGLYLVKNQDTSKIETVYCDFGTSVFQEVIGNLNVQTKTVHFYVQKNYSFNTFDAIIPFELARLNEGGAFDLASGTFTAPVKGVYHFQLSAVKDSTAEYGLWIYLLVNGNDVGHAFTSQTFSQPFVTGTMESASLSASLRLEKGDRVNLLKSSNGVLFDGSSFHSTHFSGWLVEEDLM